MEGRFMIPRAESIQLPASRNPAFRCVLELSTGQSSTKTFTLLSYDKLTTPGGSRFVL